MFTRVDATSREFTLMFTRVDATAREFTLMFTRVHATQRKRPVVQIKARLIFT
jgi:hypothetical protein